MHYSYVSSPLSLEEIFEQVNLRQNFVKRVKQIISIVNDYAEIYDLSKSQEKILTIESIIYSYERVGERSPIEDYEEIKKKIDFLSLDIQVENEKNKRWCGIAKWLSCL